MQNYKYLTLLTIAGSDSGGGAGIQADLKTFSALGCYGTSAITAITVQNTLGVSAIHPVPASIVEGQIMAVMNDIKPGAIKIGMLPNIDVVKTVGTVLKNFSGIPIILDPVMSSSSGTLLQSGCTKEAIIEYLFPISTLITPNIDEAMLFTGHPIKKAEDMQLAASLFIELGCNAVLVKGGHLSGNELFNLYANKNGETTINSFPHIDTINTHGTGCTLSSAIAAYLVLGESLKMAIKLAGDYVHKAIKEGQYVKTGQGCGPLNHFYNPLKLAGVV